MVRSHISVLRISKPQKQTKLVDCGIPRDSRNFKINQKEPSESCDRETAALSEYVSVYMVVDKLNFLWSLMGSESIGTS